MDSTDSHDAQVQVPGPAPVSGAAEQASAPSFELYSKAHVKASAQANPQASAQADAQVPVQANSEKPGVFAAGTIVGASYEVIELLGRGAMGMVYRVRHVTLSTEYALKILTDDKQNEVSVIRFQNEAQAIAKLNHPNIVAIYNFGVHDGSLPFYVMDLLAGEDLLDKILCDGPMTPEVALPLFIEACAGLSYAHRKGILHRDVKPANFLILEKPDVHGANLKVVDFGIVKFAEELKPEVQKLTAMGVVCGSPSYMSPEQAMGQKVDPRSDIYSLGCSLFEALTGKVPFRGRSASDTMMMHATSPAPTLAEKNPEKVYSDDLENVIARMMAKEQMYRYQSMDAVAHDLKNILEGKPLAASPMAARPFAKSQFGVAGQSEGAVTLSLGRDNKVSGTTSNRNSALFDDRRYSSEQEASGEYETDDDDDSEDERGRSSTKVKVALVSLVVVGIVGAVCFFAMKLQTPVSPSESKAVESYRIPSMDLHVETKSLSDELGLDNVSPDPDVGADSIVLSREKYFSKAVEVDGQPFVQFDFPVKPISHPKVRPVAWIGTSLNDKAEAWGKLKYPQSAKLYLVPSPNVVCQKNFLTKFRKGDIYEVIVWSFFATDQLAIDCTKVPGIRGFSISDCPELTTRIIPALNSLSGLESFSAFKSTIDGADLAKLKFLPNLNQLVLSRCVNITPILMAVSGSKKLETLYVSDTGIGPRDYRLISNLPNLKALMLNGNKVSCADLHCLSRLSHLEQLSLMNVRLKAGDAARELAQFPSLKVVCVDRGRFRNQDIAYLREHSPSLRFSWSSHEAPNIEH